MEENMHNRFGFLLFMAVLFCSTFIKMPIAQAVVKEPAEKDWTFLIFMNGNNNLDSFGAMDLNEMETVGSTENINVVVQWASLDHGGVRRVYVQKDNNSREVTSPIVENMGRVDMGDWRNLVEFVKWGATNYPAKHYFINVWDHGNGWHLSSSQRLIPNDISWDDLTGNFMTTQQLGQAMREAAEFIGHKIDLYGSDACLMGMAEVADEMSDSVQASVGSEEVEPAEGWPYDGLLAAWSQQKSLTAQDVAKILTNEYVKSYQNGSQGTNNVTFSAYDLTVMERFNNAIRNLGVGIMTLDASDRRQVVRAATQAQSFTYSDYIDLMDFLTYVESSNISRLATELFTEIKSSVQQLVIANVGTPAYKHATGIAIWLPTSMSDYQANANKYQALRFQANTSWGNALQHLLQDTR
jgi:hypothetical protein